MPIQDYMVDENHWHFTNFNLKHLCVWHTIDREKLRKVKLVGFTDDDNRTKVLKKVKVRLFIKSQLSDEWNEASKLFHHNCSPSSFVSSGLSRWLRNKEAGCADELGLAMVLLWYEAKPFLISQILFVASLCAPWQIANNHLPSTSPPTFPVGEC